MSGVEVQIRLKPLGLKDGAQETDGWSSTEQVLFRQDTRFIFNRVHSMQTSNSDLFQAIEPFVSAAFGGQNVTVMAYGQTGSGKTHSMLGTAVEKGFIPRAAELLLKLVNTHGNARLTGSCIEIYNETIRDLVDVNHNVMVTEVRLPDGTETVHVDRKENQISTLSDFVLLSNRAESHRQYAGTQMNDRSSRSHTILSFNVIRDCGKSTINFVDLAGSECTAKSKTAGTQLREGNFINKSLLALGNVVDAIVDGRSHIPYRESKLTRVLRPCLGGKSLAYILTCVNTATTNVAETTAALRFAQRAMKVKNDPTLTLQMPPLLSHSLNQQISRVMSEMEATEQAAYSKGLHDTFVFCNPTVERIFAAGGQETDSVKHELRALQIALIAYEKKLGLDRIAAANEDMSVRGQSLDDVKKLHTREMKRLRDGDRALAEAHEKLARAERTLAREVEESDRAETELLARLELAESAVTTPQLELEQDELTQRLRLQMDERQECASVMEYFAQGFPTAPEDDGSLSARDLLVMYGKQIEQRRKDVESLEEAAHMATEGVNEADLLAVHQGTSIATEERVFELMREEERLDRDIRSAVRSQSRATQQTQSRRRVSRSPAATVTTRSRARGPATATASPGTLVRSTLQQIHDVRNQLSPAMARSPQQRKKPAKSASRHADPMADEENVDIDEIVGIATRRRIMRERAAASQPSDAAKSPSFSRSRRFM